MLRQRVATPTSRAPPPRPMRTGARRPSRIQRGTAAAVESILDRPRKKCPYVEIPRANSRWTTTEAPPQTNEACRFESASDLGGDQGGELLRDGPLLAAREDALERARVGAVEDRSVLDRPPRTASPNRSARTKHGASRAASATGAPASPRPPGYRCRPCHQGLAPSSRTPPWSELDWGTSPLAPLRRRPQAHPKGRVAGTIGNQGRRVGAGQLVSTSSSTRRRGMTPGRRAWRS